MLKELIANVSVLLSDLGWKEKFNVIFTFLAGILKMDCEAKFLLFWHLK